MTPWRLTTAAVLLALGARTASAQSLQGLPPGERPIHVTINAYLIDLIEINEQNLSFEMSAYLALEWRDPRLSQAGSPSIDREALTIDQIWHPNIELSNEYNERTVNNRVITVTPDGVVRLEERFETQLSSELQLRKFPFDRQTLRMGIESFRYDTSQLQLILRQDEELRSPSAFLPDWYLLDVRHELSQHTNNPKRLPYAWYLFDIDVARKFEYYIWKMFVPLAFIVLLPWTAFWIDAKDVRARVSLTMTALLTAIALSLSIAGSRPRVSYVTYFDAVFLNGFFVIFLATITVVAEHYVQQHSPAITARTSRLGRVAYPCLLVVSNLALIVIFLF